MPLPLLADPQVRREALVVFLPPELPVVADEVGAADPELLLQPAVELGAWDSMLLELSDRLSVQPRERSSLERPARLIEHAQQDHPEPRRVRDRVHDLMEDLVQREVRVDARRDLQHLLDPGRALAAREELVSVEVAHLVACLGQLLVPVDHGVVGRAERLELVPKRAAMAQLLHDEEHGGREGPDQLHGRNHVDTFRCASEELARTVPFRAIRRSNSFTTRGSNCVPEHRLTSASASASGMESR